MSTPFHVRWAPKAGAEKPVQKSAELAKFQDLLRELFQFDCAELDFGIYRIMNHKRGVIDRYIEKELPGAVEEAMRQGAIGTEAERAETFDATPYDKLRPRYGDGSWTQVEFTQRHILFPDERGDYLETLLEPADT